MKNLVLALCIISMLLNVASLAVYFFVPYPTVATQTEQLDFRGGIYE